MKKRNITTNHFSSFLGLFVIMVILLYFIFPEDTLSDYLTTSGLVTLIYHLPVLINFIKNKRAKE